ncbi:DUF6283 family protein [Streptomyces eurythermus]|uniref:DUF6283 family protein n=1 Tax=Streptomyces eurythermus TaxID=42237 RepID=UPI0036D3269F
MVPVEPAAQARPCSGRQVCPWRRDAPAGQFPPQVFEHSAPGNRLAGPVGWFGCHSSTEARPLLCAGRLLAGADGNDSAREMISTGVLPGPELPDGVELYGSYAEMAIANGVDPGLPALYERSVGRPTSSRCRSTSPTTTRARTTGRTTTSGGEAVDEPDALLSLTSFLLAGGATDRGQAPPGRWLASCG